MRPVHRFLTGLNWGYSSAGRALAWHARGQRFDPAYLHQNLKNRPLWPVFCFLTFPFLFSPTFINHQIPDIKKGAEAPFLNHQNHFTMLATYARTRPAIEADSTLTSVEP